jgi:hypothetical protein
MIAGMPLVLVLCGASHAAAQTGSVPNGSVLTGNDDRQLRQKLDFTFTVSEGYDSESPDHLRGLAIGDNGFNGYSTIFAGSAEYKLQKPRIQVGASVSTDFRYFNEIDDLRNVSDSAALGVSGRLGDRTNVLVNQSVAYSPSYLYGLFPTDSVTDPGEAIPPAPDYAVNNLASYAYYTTASLTHNLSARNRIVATGTVQLNEFTGEASTQPDLTTRGIQGQFSRNLSRHTALVAGYVYETGTFGSFSLADTTVSESSAYEHGIQAGVSYVRPVSKTRRMEFSASLGTSAVSVPTFLIDPGNGAVQQGTDRERLYRATSDIAFSYQFKAWYLSGYYRRGLDYIAQLRQPVFVDGVSANVTALLAPRLDFSAVAGYANGSSAVFSLTQPFDTYTADARLRWAVTRGVAAYGEYVYYFYDFLGSTVAAGMPRRLERNGVRVGVTLWVPAFRR